MKSVLRHAGYQSVGHWKCRSSTSSIKDGINYFPYLADEVVFVFVSVVFSRQMVEHGSRSPSLYSEIVFIAV